MIASNQGLPQCLVIGALLGTQNGREVEIVNTFELAMEDDTETVDHGFFIARKDQCKYHHRL